MKIISDKSKGRKTPSIPEKFDNNYWTWKTFSWKNVLMEIFCKSQPTAVLVPRSVSSKYFLIRKRLVLLLQLSTVFWICDMKIHNSTVSILFFVENVKLSLLYIRVELIWASLYDHHWSLWFYWYFSNS